MNAPVRDPVRGHPRVAVGAGTATLFFVAAVAALFALAVIGIVIAFVTPTNPWPWVGAGFLATCYLGSYLLIF